MLLLPAAAGELWKRPTKALVFSCQQLCFDAYLFPFFEKDL
jgi:hypothetical protein